MRLTCPACGACGSIEFFLRDAAERRSLVAALKLPPSLADRVVAYLALFRPGKRALTWDRVERILAELMAPIGAAQVERHGRIWAAPLASWEQAFDELLGKRESLRLPLKSHGYLFEIIVGIAQRAEARGEMREEARRRQGGSPEPIAEPVDRGPGGRPTDALVEAEMRRFAAADSPAPEGDPEVSDGS